MARYRVGLETRARIVGAVRDLLAEVGLDGTTIKAICARAGIGAGSFYNLFPTKEEAILEVVREAIRAVDPDPEGAHTDTVEDLVGAYVDFVTATPALARIYLELAIGGQVAGDGEDRAFTARVLRHHRYRVERFAEALLRSDPGLSPDDVADRAESLVAALNGFTMTWLLDPKFDIEAHARRLAAETVRA